MMREECFTNGHNYLGNIMKKEKNIQVYAFVHVQLIAESRLITVKLPVKRILPYSKPFMSICTYMYNKYLYIYLSRSSLFFSGNIKHIYVLFSSILKNNLYF